MECTRSSLLLSLLVLLAPLTAMTASLSPDPMAASVERVKGSPKSRIWVTTTGRDLAAYSLARRHWQTFRGNVKGGVAATSYERDGKWVERIFVPSGNAIVDLAVEDGVAVSEHLLRTETGDSFESSDVHVLSYGERLAVAAISTVGHFCVWEGTLAAGFSRPVCSGPGYAGKDSAIAGEVNGGRTYPVFFVRGADDRLIAIRGMWVYFGTHRSLILIDYNLGTPPATAGIGNPIANFTHAAAGHTEIAALAGNAVWIAQFDMDSMNVTWKRLSKPPSVPRDHKAALSIDGSWFSTFTSDMKQCRTNVYMAGTDGRLHVSGGGSTIWNGAACLASIYADDAWNSLPAHASGRWRTTQTVPTMHNIHIRWLAIFGANQEPLSARLLEHTASGVVDHGQP